MKKLASALFCIILIISLCITAHAHAGRTDSNGGHTDSSTGEYHYHHGYPAHDHYDMDSDGVVDCPYQFDDKTSQNSGSPSHSDSVSVTNNSSTHDLKNDFLTFPSLRDIVFKLLLIATALFAIPFLVAFVLNFFPNPVGFIIEKLSVLSSDPDRAYRKWFIFIIVILDILVVRAIITLR